ncbi:spermatogenesis-associated protein 6-like [Actinia tenebrosa]|uniref:Spermatogenesis-associated protein 6-like n=1 Tax=Actinia tenebrosa TaxID=6105 RepID=A0A6P8I8K9_ACTTE|nr:spermatogenesis-associated protein 6-like [Actinia tenebrosa]
MPRKAMKVIVELDIHTVTCPGTFLRDYGYVYLKVNCMGLEVNTKSVPPTFPLFFHERLRFERVFRSCQDPAYVSIHLKGEDILIELRQHDDYISDGYVIGHYANNARDYLYPAVAPYPGTGRELTLFKTSLFNPIRITGQPLRLEFSTKTTIKEVPDPDDFNSSPNLKAALGASDRIQERVERILDTKDRSLMLKGDSDDESVDSLDILRDSLREERRAISDAIREADRAAYYKSLGIDL